MDLRQLEYYVELCKTRNFTKASERLNVAQPSITKAVQQLEDELGVQLVDRSQRPLGLTEAGARFFTQVSYALEQLYDAAQEAKNASRLRRAISFGVAPISGTALIHLLETTNMVAEDIFYNMVSLSSVEICDRLMRRELDLGWVFSNDLPPELDYIPVEVQEALLVLPADHPLQSREEITFADLRDESFAMMVSDKSSSLMALVVERCREAGFSPRNSIVVRQYHPSRRLAIECIRAGYGVGLSPEHSVAEVTDLPIRHMSPPLLFEVGLAYRKGDKLPQDARRLAQFILKNYPPFVGKPSISTKI